MDQSHVLIFPFPIQGHVNSMLKLAELLCLAGVHVTFLVTDYIHGRLLRHTNIQNRLDSYTGFRLETISDGLPDNHPRSGERIVDLFASLKTVKPLFRELISSDRPRIENRPPLKCVIADGILSFALDVAEEVGIPVIYFRTASACNFWTYFCIPQLIEAGELPFKGTDLDVPIKSVAGMEGFLRRRDLPNFFRVDDLTDPIFQMVNTETRQTTRAQGLILNTFEDLEGPILSHIRTHFPNLYAIGPLHDHLKKRLESEAKPSQTFSNSLWEEDKSCITWLDTQPYKSVIYVSFGSIAILKRDQLMEFWYGLINSGKRFLWVIRPDLVVGEEDSEHHQIPTDLEEGTKERGHMVAWAPQEEVLAHPSIGGFLTHSGWNSTLESIVVRVPMICWPYFGDQHVNSRYVSDVWKVGLDMKDTCDKVVVEKMVNDLMEIRREEFLRSIDQMAELARTSISGGGSSCSNLDRLIEDIRLMGV